MKVVRLTAADAAEYRSLMLHGYEHAADAFTSTAEERAAEPLSWWEKRIAHPRGLSVALGAIDEGKLVGSVALEFSAKPKTRHRVQLIGMYVLGSHRGRGIAKALVNAAIECVKSRPGVEVIGLVVTDGNEPALRLYKECGFAEFGTEPMGMLISTGYTARVHMWRRVSGEDPAA
jgi:ribosomal protein S18 acetylase RimI-like enzyme